MFDVKVAIQEMAQGNAAAEEFCAILFHFIHMQDDLFDKDKPVTALELARMNYYLISMLAFNQFFHQHKEKILPVILTSSMAWAASEAIVGTGTIEHITAQVLKSQYQDIFYLTAFLVGGQAHLETMSSKYREYNFD